MLQEINGTYIMFSFKPNKIPFKLTIYRIIDVIISILEIKSDTRILYTVTRRRSFVVVYIV